MIHYTPASMHAWEQSRFSRMSGPLGLMVLTCAGVAVLSSIGLGQIDKRWIGPLNAAVNVFSAGPFALAYVLGAWGWGRPLAYLLARESASRHYIQFALGVGVLLFISHLLGMSGVLSAGAGNEHAVGARLWGWASVGVGLVLLIDQVGRTTLRPEKWPVMPKASMVLAPALAVLIVATCNAPGFLWQSEHGAYDALSYHLQLPKEWAAGERLWPVQHNVYSYLPSYMEAAYLHLGTLMPGPSDPLLRMIGGDGAWILACQFLHAMLMIAAAALTGRAAAVASITCGVPEGRAGFLGVLAASLVLATPWSIVTGSLPYNESGMMLAFAGGVLAALDDRMKPWARGVATGLLAGIATSCKPTSAFMVAPAIGIALLAFLRPRRWPMAVACGTIAGCLVIAPWLIRNARASGNPVFPFAAEQFGMGHWTLEQVARYGRAHAFYGTLIERLARLFSPLFGLRHEQWALTLILLAASVVATMVWKPVRRLGAILCVCLVVQCVGWAMLSHLQSRFLLPILIPAAILCALMGAALLARFAGGGLSIGGRSLAGIVLALAPLATSAWAAALFVSEGTFEPNQMLILGTPGLTGAVLEDRVRALPEDEAEKFLKDKTTPAGYLNTVIRPQETADAGVYLLGDGAPLYIFGASGLPAVETGGDGGKPRQPRSPVYYHTTWDASPLGSAMLASPNEPRAWTTAMMHMGVRFVMVNFDELHRLTAIDQNYDPNVSLKLVLRWINEPGTGVTEVQAWPRPGARPDELSGQALYRLDASGASLSPPNRTTTRHGSEDHP